MGRVGGNCERAGLVALPGRACVMTWPGVITAHDNPPREGERPGDYAARVLLGGDMGRALREVAPTQSWPRDSVRAHAEFCRQRNVVPGAWWSGRVNLFGYGTVKPFFHGEDDEWFALVDLAGPTGIEWARLTGIFDEMASQPADEPEIEGCGFGHGTAVLPFMVGAHTELRLLSLWRVMQLFALYSPWSREFREQTRDSVFHALSIADLKAHHVREESLGCQHLEPIGRRLSELSREEADARLTRGPIAPEGMS